MHLKTYQELIENYKEQLNKLEKESTQVIMSSLEKYKDYKSVILTSTGKDSIVLTYLVQKHRPLIPTKFNNTTLDTYQTYQIAKNLSNNEIMNPPEGFFQWQKRYNYVPTQMYRACCAIFKEGITKNYINESEKYLLFYGMRNAESKTRADYMYEWKNKNWATDNWIGILPIRKWTDFDIWLYTFKIGLQINPVYTFGYNRVGCTVPCPYRTDYENFLDSFYFPKSFNRWQKILKEDFIKNYKWPSLNCTIQEYLNGAWKHGVFREEPTQEAIEEFAQYKNLDIEIAKKYFNKKCGCGKKVKKDEIGLMMKYFGRKIAQFFCMDCLSTILGRSKKELKQDIKDFKMQGCDLF